MENTKKATGRLLTTSELAEYFSVHVATIKSWAQSGKIRGYKAGADNNSGEWRFNLSEVLNDLRKGIHNVTRP